MRDLQRDEASARPQHAAALGEEFTEVNKITEQERIRYNVNTGVLQGQGEYICLQEIHREALLRQACMFLLREVEHRRRKIGAEDHAGRHGFLQHRET